MPTGKGLGNAVRAGHAIGCTAVQVFTSSPQTWKAKPITDEMVADLAAACAETGINHLVSHDSYLVNLCSPNEEGQAKSIAGLRDELLRCAKLGIPSVVSHIGAHMGTGEEAAMTVAAANIRSILSEIPTNVSLLMETTAGQGSCLNHRFEELAKLLELTGAPANLGICVDTCHVFAAGYDLRTREHYEATWAAFDQLVGIDRIRAIHANDSKKPLGSRVDRHAHIGEGEIGLEPFRWLVNDPRFQQIPIVVETPEAETHHAVNVRVLQDLVEA